MNASSTTVLRLGKLKAPIALYKTVGDAPGIPAWDREPEPADATPAVKDPLAPAVSGFSGGGNFTRKATPKPAALARPRGLILADGSFLDLTEQIARIETHTQLNEMNVIAFIRREQVPREMIQGSYWIGVNGPGGGRTLKLIHAATKKVGRVAVVRWTKRTRQAYGILLPHRSGALIAVELAWADTWREPDERIMLPYVAAEVTDEEVATAARLIDAMGDSRAILEEMEDDAVVLRRELVRAARAGEDVTNFLAEVPDALPEDLVSELERTLRG